MRARDYIKQLAMQGRHSFATEDIQKALGSSPIAIKNALRRLRANKEIASPIRGYHLILSPEYQNLGSLPAEQFIDSLMKYLGEPYYVALLSAAARYGASHHQPQIFQVMTVKNRPDVICGQVRIKFIAKKELAVTPTQTKNTRTGAYKLSTPEATALDLVIYAKRAAGMENVLNVLTELIEEIQVEELIKNIEQVKEIAHIQRLGFLLEMIGAEVFTNSLTKHLKCRKVHLTPLIAGASTKGMPIDNKWQIIINETLEADV